MANPNSKTLVLKNSALWIVALLLPVISGLMVTASPGLMIGIVAASTFVLMLASNALLSSASGRSAAKTGDQ